MKKTLFLSMAMAFVTFAALAQESNAAPQIQMQARGGSVEDRAKRQADRINASAQLSTDQYAKVLDICKNFAAQREAIHNSGAEGDDLKAKFKALNEQQEAQLKTVLTADQMAKVQAARKQHAGGAPHGE